VQEFHAQPRRRWRISLRALFVLVTLVACWLGWRVYQVRHREALRREYGLRGAVVRSVAATESPRLPLMWRLVGAVPVRAIELPSDVFTEADRARLEPWFPEATVTIYPRPVGMM
jgi:hypothetical protein